jgi:Uma2 family endonuclease
MGAGRLAHAKLEPGLALIRPLNGATLNLAMKSADLKFTYHDYLQLPEDRRYELVEGELFLLPTPSLSHQGILRELEARLYQYIREHDLGKLFFAPCDVVFSETSVVQPDLLFVSKERLGILTEANIQGPPDLVIEILSPSTRTRDLGIKRKLYAKYGVREYWVVDPEERSIEVFCWSEHGFATAVLASEPGILNSPLFPELGLHVGEIFLDLEASKGSKNL